MLTPPQTSSKVLLISPLCFVDQTIVQISEQIIAHNNKHSVKIMAKSLERSSELDLKLALLIQPSSHIQKQEWVLCMASEWKRGFGKQYDGICVIVEDDGWVEQTGAYVFAVRGLRESLGIIGMSNIELQKRWKMELLIRKSNLKYQNNKFIYFLRSTAIRLMQSSVNQQTKSLARYMNFYGYYRLKKMRFFFTKWLVWHYESVIHKNQNEIINGDYLIQNSNRKILQKYFAVWKTLKIKKNPLLN